MLVLILVTFGMPGEAQAYPWLIRHGYTNCGACHADPSGGELLTLYGHAMTYEVLSSRWGRAPSSSRAPERRTERALARAGGAKNALQQDGVHGQPTGDSSDGQSLEPSGEHAPEPNPDQAETDSSASAESLEADSSSEDSAFQGMGPLTGQLFGLGPATERLLLGGSLRLASLVSFGDDEGAFRVFPMQLDVYAQGRLGNALRAAVSLGAIKVPTDSPHGRAAQVTTNQGDGFNLISRTHWIGYDLEEGAHTIRAGRLNVPFGIRLPEHVLWVRERTQTDRESDQQHGVALYMGFENLRFELMAILGNYQLSPDAFRERGYAGYLELVAADKLILGLSSLVTRAADDRLEPSGRAVTRQAHGPFLRAAPIEAVAILAEADLLLRSERAPGYVGFLQVDAEPIRGLHWIVTGEILDAGYPDSAKRANIGRSAGLGKPQPGAWLSVQWFFLPHFDMRIDAIIREDKQLLTQLHVYL